MSVLAIVSASLLKGRKIILIMFVIAFCLALNLLNIILIASDMKAK